VKLLFSIKALNNPGGGAERVLVDVAGGLRLRGHEVTVLTFDSPSAGSFFQLDSSIKHVSLPIGDTRKDSSLPVILARVLKLRSAVTAESPDIVVGFMHSMFVPLGLALLGSRIPLIACEHTVYQHYSARKLQAIVPYLVPLIADLTTCVTERARLTYPSFLRRRMTVLPNPVTVCPQVRADVIGDRRDRKLLLAVGRLEIEKDYSSLINSFARVAAHFRDWDLRIVGEGSLRSKLEKQIATLRLEKRISLPGKIKDVSKEYANAQLYVIPSRYESFSLTTAEALAHGLPVVGFSDCPGIDHWISPGVNGVLVAPNSDRAKSLADGLLPLMQSAELRRRLANGSVRLEEHRLEPVLDRWESVLNSVSRSC
jgi:glycosyltransferase involved in cell wall biosynthesis